MQAITVLSNLLKEGDQIDETKLLNMQKESEIEIAFNKAIKKISLRMHSKYEIENYLRTKGFLPEIISIVVNRLEEYKYLNDEEYARTVVKSYKLNGRNAIIQKLKQRGIEQATIDMVLNNTEDMEYEKAKEALKKYIRTHDKDKINYPNIYRYLIAKGFSYDIASSVSKAIEQQGD